MQDSPLLKAGGLIAEAILSRVPPASTESTSFHASYIPLLGMSLDRLELHKVTGQISSVRPSQGMTDALVDDREVRDAWLLVYASHRHAWYSCAAYSLMGKSCHVASCARKDDLSGGKAIATDCEWPIREHNGHPVPCRIFVELLVFHWACREEAWGGDSPRNVRNVILSVLRRWPFLMPLLPGRLVNFTGVTIRSNINEGWPSRHLFLILWIIYGSFNCKIINYEKLLLSNVAFLYRF